MSPLTEEAVRIAGEQVGQTEKPLGSNWGHPVEEYLDSVGINFPASWCAAFVYWCYQQAAFTLKVKNPLFRTGGVINQYKMSKSNQALVPQAGDVFVLSFGLGLGHIGIIEFIDAKGVLHTIEGNSNNDGSRNGTSVVRHTRSISDPHMKGYLRY